MRSLARYTLLLILVSICYATSLAQDGGAKSVEEPPPPPLPAREYNPNSWKEYSSPGGRFAILFPGTPVEKIDTIDTALGNLAIHSVSLSSAAEYSASYIDFPMKLEDPSRVKQHLDDGRDGGVKGVNGQLLAEREITIEGHPGRYLKVRAGGGYIIRSKIIIVENRSYTLTAITNDTNASDAILRFHEEIAAKFLDSFRLTTEQKALGEVDELLSKGDIYVLGSKDASSKPTDLIDGVLNGRAISLPKPVYPPVAKAARASGTVVVKVVVDETGKVIAAQAESGHPLLQAAAVKAARGARFDPPLVEGKPSKIVGIISYNFTL